MDFNLGSRLMHAWNTFKSRDPTGSSFHYFGPSAGYRPDKAEFSRINAGSITTPIYNRIAMDCAAISIVHARVDENRRFTDEVDSGLNYCLTVEPNIDQTPRAFIQDVVISLLDEGSVAIVPVDTTSDISKGSFDITTMRVGKILQWYPQFVQVLVYNDRTGKNEKVVLPKNSVCIIENPLYAIINGKNSTLQRLLHKMRLLDSIDEQVGSGKLDMIIQLPYAVKTAKRKEMAEERRKDIETQLSSSAYGIAYMDATERITQLNRPLENGLFPQIQQLTEQLYSQLGITQSILDGTADDKTMLNYYNRTIEPIVSAITDEMKRKFLTKTARTQGQSILFFRDPFRLVPVNQLAEIADKFTRNEIMTSNEIRQIVNMKPSKDPAADELRNKNLSQSSAEAEEKLSQVMQKPIPKAEAQPETDQKE